VLGPKSANENCEERAAVEPIARFTLQRSERAAGSQYAAGLVARGFRVRYRSVKIVIEIKFETTT